MKGTPKRTNFRVATNNLFLKESNGDGDIVNKRYWFKHATTHFSKHVCGLRAFITRTIYFI